MPTTPMPPTFPSPFISLSHYNTNPPPRLRILILSDLHATPQRIARLSEWLCANSYAFSIDLILVIGVSRPHQRTDIPHIDLAEQGNDSITLSELEQICSRVIYVPGLHEPGVSWSPNPPSLSVSSLNAIRGPVHIAQDLVVVHRRYADGLSEKPVQQLPNRWRQTLYTKLSRPKRFRVPKQSSAIVLCSSQLPNQGSSSKSLAFLRTVRSLLSINRTAVKDLDFILAISPPKMQRVPNSSPVLKNAERILDPGSFVEGEFWIVDLQRPSVWDPVQEPEVDEDQLLFESAWEVLNTTKHSIDHPAGEDISGD